LAGSTDLLTVFKLISEEPCASGLGPAGPGPARLGVMGRGIGIEENDVLLHHPVHDSAMSIEF